MNITEARETLDFLNSREDAAANGCEQDWDEAWEAAFPAYPVHVNTAGGDYYV